MIDRSKNNKRQVSRKDQADAKLHAGLHRLTTGAALHPANQGISRLFTVAALSREAGVARNAIYTSHREFLDQLTDLAAGKTRAVSNIHDETNRRELETRISRLATDNAVLLKRALDAERRVERLGRRCASLLKQRDTRLSVTTLPTP